MTNSLIDNLMSDYFRFSTVFNLSRITFPNFVPFEAHIISTRFLFAFWAILIAYPVSIQVAMTVTRLLAVWKPMVAKVSPRIFLQFSEIVTSEFSFILHKIFTII